MGSREYNWEPIVLVKHPEDQILAEDWHGVMCRGCEGLFVAPMEHNCAERQRQWAEIVAKAQTTAVSMAGEGIV